MLAWCILYAGILVLTGFSATSVLLSGQRRGIAECAGLSLLLGPGVCGTLLLWLSLMGLRPERWSILLFAMVGVAGLAAMHFRGMGLQRPQLPRLDRDWRVNATTTLLVLGLVAGNISILVPALGFGLFEWDSFTMWGMRAKVLYYSALLPRPEFFTDVRFSFSHLDYPPLGPMLTAGAYAMMGQVDDRLGKIVLPVILAGQTLLLFSALRLFVGRIASLALTLLLVCSPNNLLYAGLGIADVMLATFWLGSITYLIRWFRSRLICDAVLAALFAVFVVLTKPEGLAMAMMALLTMLFFAFRYRVWRQPAVYLAIFAVGVIPWLAWRAGVPHTDENYLAHLHFSRLVANFSRLRMILPGVATCLVDVRQWSGLWLLLVVMASLGWRALLRMEARLLWILVVAHLGLYVMAYLIGSWDDIASLLTASVSRLILHIAPIGTILIAVHWREILLPRDEKVRADPRRSQNP